MAHGINQQELINNPLESAFQAVSYGPDTKELLRRIATSTDGSLDVSNLKITRLPELPHGLKKLDCSNTRIKMLPELPSTLEELNCSNTPLHLKRDPGESIYSYNIRMTVFREAYKTTIDVLASIASPSS